MATYVHTVIKKYPMSDEKLNSCREATASDPTLQAPIEYTKDEWSSKEKISSNISTPWLHSGRIDNRHRACLKRHTHCRSQLTPQRSVTKIHRGHLGIKKYIARVREYVYWPDINVQMKERTNTCFACIDHRNQQPVESPINHEISVTLWTKVATDIFHLYGKSNLNIKDYTKYFNVHKIKGYQSSTVIKKLKIKFSKFGIPQIVFSDNGPESKSLEFETFAKAWDFNHTRSGYPQANGILERNIQKAIKTNTALLAFRTKLLKMVPLLQLNN